MLSRKRKQVALGIAGAALLFAMGGFAYAHDVPDLGRTGQIEITMRLGEESVGGGVMGIYRVGEVVESDGNYSFAPIGVFADGGFDFAGGVQSADLARRLAEYAPAHGAPSTRMLVNPRGLVVFDDLAPGLYLVVQVEAAKGYEACAPFLVSLPTMVDGIYYYEVDASPKVELAKKPEEPREPNIPQTADAAGAVAGEAGLGVLAGMGLMAGGLLLGRGGMRGRA